MRSGKARVLRGQGRVMGGQGRLYEMGRKPCG